MSVFAIDTIAIFMGHYVEFEGDDDPFHQPWTDLWTDEAIDADPTHWMPLPEAPQ